MLKEESMLRRVVMFMMIAVGFMIAFLIGNKLAPVQGAQPANGLAAVPGEKGGFDFSGPYDVVPDWPKPLSQLPGHEKWTWGAMQGVYAETPNRIFIVMRGELPLLKRPLNTPVPESGPSLSFPVNQTVFRNASQGPVA